MAHKKIEWIDWATQANKSIIHKNYKKKLKPGQKPIKAYWDYLHDPKTIEFNNKY